MKILLWIILKVHALHYVVQSLNSTFFPPHIGAEPGRAKEESRITCMRMLRTPPFFSPQIGGKKPYLEVLSRFGLWRDILNDNIQATISAFRLIKNMSINPKSVEFHLRHAKPHSICFFSITLSKITKEIFENTDSDLKVHVLIMQMSYLYASDFPFKNFCKIVQHID